jgi:hypothetical protein
VPLGISLQPLVQINCAIINRKMAKLFALWRINRECCCYLLIARHRRGVRVKNFLCLHLGERVCVCFLRCAPHNFSARHVFALSAVPLFTTHKQTACSLSTFLLFLAPRFVPLYTFRGKSRSTRATGATDKNKLSHFSGSSRCVI